MPAYTKDRLLEIAVEAQSRYEARLALFPAGTYDLERNEARRLHESAMLAALSLEETGEREANAVGSFCDFTAFKGQKLTLKEGAMVRTTHPQKRGGYRNPRRREVTVHNQSFGKVDPYGHHQGSAVRNPEITWVGSGGYWFWADINDFDLDGVESEAAHA